MTRNPRIDFASLCSSFNLPEKASPRIATPQRQL